MKLIRPAITKLVDAASHFIDVRRWFDKLIDSLKFTKAQKWCFIAGTPVMTMAGPLPIEQIEPGMMVWSAPECGTGQACYRPVLETYRNRAPEVWHVSYDHDADDVPLVPMNLAVSRMRQQPLKCKRSLKRRVRALATLHS